MMKNYNSTSSPALVIYLSLLLVSTAAAQQRKVDSQVKESPPPAVPESTLWEQAQGLYEQAKRSGSTTAASAADWVGELYDSATGSAQDATAATTNWISGQYQNALKAGETTAKTTKEWVVDDLSKIGTWQYKVVNHSDSSARIEKKLNELGDLRWECFSVHYSSGGDTTLFLKRRHRSYLQQLPAKDLLRLAPLLGGEAGEKQE
jgi:hypothetical protein